MPLPTTFAGASIRGEGMFSASLAIAQNYWINTFADYNQPSVQNTKGVSVAVDGSGNTYTTGIFNTTNAKTNTFLVKTNSLGVVQWEKNINGPAATTSQYDGSSGVTVDSSGNSYIIGYAKNTSGGENAFVAKYNTSGAIQWQRFISDALAAGSQADYGYGVAVDGSGNVCVTGIYFTSSNDSLTFVVKYNSSGTLQWQRSLIEYASSPKSTISNCITTDSSGNIYVAGSYRDIAGTGVRHGFILKYNGSGVLQLQRSITDFNTTTSSDASVNGIAVDGSNNIYVTGSYINPSGGTNCFTAKYNSSGTPQWFRSLADSNAAASQLTRGNGITVDASGNSYVIGYYLTSGSGYQSFVAKYNTSGVLQWQGAITDTTSATYPYANQGLGITSDSFGSIFLTGQLTNSQIDAFSTSNRGTNAYLMKLPNTGGLLGTYTLGSGQTLIYSAGTLTESKAKAESNYQIIVRGSGFITRINPLNGQTIGTDTLPSGISGSGPLVVDSTGTYAYMLYGTTLYKINLKDWTLNTSISIGANYVASRNIVIDSTDSYLYLAGQGTTGTSNWLMKINLSTFSISTSMVNATTYPIQAIAIDPTNTYLYLLDAQTTSNQINPSIIYKVNTSDLSSVTTVGGGYFGNGSQIIVDPTNTYLYTVGFFGTTGNISQYAISTFTYISQVTNPTGTPFGPVVIDPTNTYLYSLAGGDSNISGLNYVTNPLKLYKYSLGTGANGALQSTGSALQLNSGYSDSGPLVMSPNGAYLYALDECPRSTANASHLVRQVDLSTFTATGINTATNSLGNAYSIYTAPGMLGVTNINDTAGAITDAAGSLTTSNGYYRAVVGVNPNNSQGSTIDKLDTLSKTTQKLYLSNYASYNFIGTACMDPSGTYTYVANNATTKSILKIDAVSGAVVATLSLPATYNYSGLGVDASNICYLAVDPTNTWLIAICATGCQIYKIAISTFTVSATALGDPNGTLIPGGFSMGPTGNNFYFTGVQSGNINITAFKCAISNLAISSAVFQTVNGWGSYNILGAGIVADATESNIYVANYQDNQGQAGIRKFNSSLSQTGYFTSTNIYGATNLCFDPTYTYLYMTTAQNNQNTYSYLVKVQASNLTQIGSALLLGSGLGSGTGVGPISGSGSLAVDPSGNNVYIGNATTQNISLVDTSTFTINALSPLTTGVSSTIIGPGDISFSNVLTKASSNVSITPALYIDVSSLQVGTSYGLAYSSSLVAGGGNNSYTYSVYSGTLPGGLSLNSSTGAITGTPTSLSGSTSVVFKVTDNVSGTSANSSSVTFIQGGPYGAHTYTTPGNYTFTVPANVTNISVVGIGSGAYPVVATTYSSTLFNTVSASYLQAQSGNMSGTGAPVGGSSITYFGVGGTSTPAGTGPGYYTTGYRGRQVYHAGSPYRGYPGGAGGYFTTNDIGKFNVTTGVNPTSIYGVTALAASYAYGQFNGNTPTGPNASTATTNGVYFGAGYPSGGVSASWAGAGGAAACISSFSVTPGQTYLVTVAGISNSTPGAYENGALRIVWGNAPTGVPRAFPNTGVSDTTNEVWN